MREAAFLAALAMISAPAGAQEPPQEGRVWKGTLGDKAITACFFEERPGTGVFYADAALEPIRLEAENDTAPDILREMKGYDDPSGPVWTLTFAEDRIVGVWRNGAETRPIRLAPQAVGLSGYGSACESGAFLDPVLAGGAVKISRETLGGTAYTVLEYTGPQRSGLADYALPPLRSIPSAPAMKPSTERWRQKFPMAPLGTKRGNALQAASLGRAGRATTANLCGRP